jgi:hypothetical protein
MSPSATVVVSNANAKFSIPVFEIGRVRLVARNPIEKLLYGRREDDGISGALQKVLETLGIGDDVFTVNREAVDAGLLTKEEMVDIFKSFQTSGTVCGRIRNVALIPVASVVAVCLARKFGDWAKAFSAQAMVSDTPQVKSVAKAVAALLKAKRKLGSRDSWLDNFSTPKHGKRFSHGPTSSSANATARAPCPVEGRKNFASVSKLLHRQRIVGAIRKDAHTHKSLLFLASPDGSDAAELRGSLPTAVRTVAVNREPISNRVAGCEYVQKKFEDVLRDATCEEFTHVFYDSTANGIAMKTLASLRRATSSRLYLTLALSRMVNGFENALRAYKIRLRAVGFEVEHVEQYASASCRTGSMLFLEARAVPSPAAQPTTPAPCEMVGNAVWVKAGASVVPGLALVSEGGALYYVGTVVDATADGQEVSVRYHDAALNPARTTEARVSKKGCVAVNGNRTVPYIERLPSSCLEFQLMRGQTRA